MATEVVDSAEARKRRKAIITSQRQVESVDAVGNDLVMDSESIVEDVLANEALPPAPAITIPEANTTSPEAVSISENAANKKRKADSEENPPLKKTQIRYDPDVPMSKEQLAAWRREARRVRNRESAAASRAKIRTRIQELEAEVDDWKHKYDEAMKQLDELQKSEA